MLHGFGPFVFIVDQILLMLLGFRPFVFVVDQVATLISISILMLLGFRPFIFIVIQIIASTSTSILMLLGFGLFFIVDRVVTTFLCPMGFWAFYFVIDQTTTYWLGGWVGVLLWVCFCRQLVLQWAKFFIELRFNSPTSYLISKNELPSMKLGLKISTYEISM